jgi:hypothetical protein
MISRIMAVGEPIMWDCGSATASVPLGASHFSTYEASPAGPLAPPSVCAWESAAIAAMPVASSRLEMQRMSHSSANGRTAILLRPGAFVSPPSGSGAAQPVDQSVELIQ